MRKNVNRNVFNDRKNVSATIVGSAYVYPLDTRMRRNVNRKGFNDRKNVSATVTSLLCELWHLFPNSQSSDVTALRLIFPHPQSCSANSLVLPKSVSKNTDSSFYRTSHVLAESLDNPGHWKSILATKGLGRLCDDPCYV